MSSTSSLNSLIDNRQKELTSLSIVDKSIIDNKHNHLVQDLREMLHDPTLGSGFIYKISKVLSQADIHNIAEYAVRKGTSPGRLFVSICHKEMGKRGVV